MSKRWLRLLLLALPLLAAGRAEGATGSIAGAFSASGPLPEPATFSAVLKKTGAEAAVASQVVILSDGALAFSFSGLEPGVYRVRLVATHEGRELALATTPEIELTAAAASRAGVKVNAPGTDGLISGTLSLNKATAAPKGKLIFVSARRVDMTHKSFMPDGMNNASFEVSEEELQAGEVKYSFAGLSYGVFKLQLMTYDYNTHATASQGALLAQVAVDLDHKTHEKQDFEGSFAAKP